MSLFVNTNVSALNAQRQLFDVGNSLSTSFERLSSGFRINSAADDAAGLQITDRMTSQVQGLNQAVRNANDAISLSQTAEGALQETTTALQRIRQLAVQSQNGINSDADREALQKEVTQLATEISRIATNSEFNGIKILDGGYSAKFLVGANSGQTISVNLSSQTMAKANIQGFSATGLGIAGETIATQAGASAMMAKIDAAISGIGAVRADLGALQNRFQSTIRNLSNISENVSAARSRIRDTDFATETADLTRNQIIQQASTTILAQANQRPQSALSLLG
ncbi:flagellin FliC [Alteromonas aestuariivivens]|uniref:Flagellin n=1 Tax=Alteromonas aestuariivivens TaxID=1938339 RepID=A0A3D8M677_9ALTE|nr:flagellin [Alteromonas aestuariivivens]RDV25034.1 flagellin FliC [Alteromonas aestuariivivens]